MHQEHPNDGAGGPTSALTATAGGQASSRQPVHSTLAQLHRSGVARCSQRGRQDADLVILPEPEDQRPAMARSRDVLPAPLGPTISSESPHVTCTVGR